MVCQNSSFFFGRPLNRKLSFFDSIDPHGTVWCKVCRELSFPNSCPVVLLRF